MIHSLTAIQGEAGLIPEGRVVVLCSPGLRSVPSWVDEMVAGVSCEAWTESLGAIGELRVREQRTSEVTLVSVVYPGARGRNSAELREGTRRAHNTLRSLAGGRMHPVRVWNFIPGITEAMLDGLDRYKAFNIGRYDAISPWFGDTAEHRHRLPTATGVGHTGRDLEIHMLMLPEPPESLENPRQRPAFEYSKQYGPKPPCFSRASIIERAGRRSLLIAGTASITGESSLHRGRIGEQLDETFTNLEALIGSSCVDESDPISRFENVRAYSPDPRHDVAIRDELEKRLRGRAFEIVRADLCRSELLVEIEGTARLDPLAGVE